MKILNFLVLITLILVNLVSCSGNRRRRGHNNHAAGSDEESVSAHQPNIRRRSDGRGQSLGIYDIRRTGALNMGEPVDNDENDGFSDSEMGSNDILTIFDHVSDTEQVSEVTSASESLATNPVENAIGTVDNFDEPTLNEHVFENTSSLNLMYQNVGSLATINAASIETISSNSVMSNEIPLTQPDPSGWNISSATNELQMAIDAENTEHNPPSLFILNMPINHNQLIHLPPRRDNALRDPLSHFAALRRRQELSSPRSHLSQNSNPGANFSDLDFLPADHPSPPGRARTVNSFSTRLMRTDSFTVSNLARRGLPSNLLRPRGMDSPLENITYPFDASDDNLIPFISDIALAESTVGRLPRYYGTHVNPETGENMIIPLPLSYALSEDSDDDSVSSSSSSSNSSSSSEDDDGTMDANEVSSVHSHQSSNEDEEQEQADLIFTPVKNTPRGTPQCPGAPIVRLISEDDQDTQKDDNVDYGADLNGFIRSCANSNARCLRAERRFDLAMQNDTNAAQRHTEFMTQEIILNIVHKYSEQSVLLTQEHLRAFEVNFDQFFKLVKNCPRKYLLNALVLALQYDEDFPKFLTLFYKLKHKIGYSYEDRLEPMILEFILNMPIISNAAFQFFSDTRNAAFVFSKFESYPRIYGKFTYKAVALALASYQENFLDYSQNPLRAWLREFNCPALINERMADREFAIEFSSILSDIKVLFASETDYIITLYKLFASVYDGNKIHLFQLQMRSQVREVLRGALLQRDLQMVETLFLNFNLENGDDYSILMVSRNSAVEVIQVDEFFCLVEIYDGTSYFSINLPLTT